MRRYFFACHDLKKASGGRAVIYDIAATLREKNDADAFVLHGSPKARYPDGRTDVPLYYSFRIPKVQLKYTALKQRLQDTSNLLMQSMSKRPNEVAKFRPSDVIVLPEIMLSAGLAAFPDNPKILLSQNPFSYRVARDRAIKAGHDPDKQIFWNLGTSISCIETLELAGLERVSYIKVRPNLDAFPYQAQKRKLITYMPRKRAVEARLMADALRRSKILDGYALVAIDGMPQSKVAELMAESLVFISMMRTEALGFPGMEAMAAGCIVIGYTGFGAREYFNVTTGFPVVEGDTKGIVETVESVIREYGEDPTRLDALRSHASHSILQGYKRDRFVQDVRATFSDIDAALGPV